MQDPQAAKFGKGRGSYQIFETVVGVKLFFIRALPGNTIQQEKNTQATPDKEFLKCAPACRFQIPSAVRKDF